MDIPDIVVSHSAEETQALGGNVAEALLREYPVGSKIPPICLFGELGSGKTTFTQGFAKRIGISDRLISPTFILMRQYEFPDKSRILYHIDLYRLTHPGETRHLGLEELFSSTGALVLIEWAERLGNLLPEPRLEIHFSTGADGTHEIRMKHVGVED